jgi:uncharacterized OB-fold protein
MSFLSETDFRFDSGRVVLVGGRCQDCAVLSFPRSGTCARCTGALVVEEVLPTRGELWSWTVQGFRPKPPYDGPEEFTPYGVGYVDLGDVIVESRLTVTVGLEIGMPMVLVEDQYSPAATTYAFAPEEDQA